MEKRNSSKKIIIIVALVLLVVASFALLLILRNNEIKQEQQRQEARSEQLEQEKAEKIEAQKQEAYELSDHVISHRGASGNEIEHTFKAYDLAISQGSHNIEQDIVISKEGTLYVSHDLTASRLTGNNGTYSNMTDAQIDELRTTDGQKILKLSDVFDKYGKEVVYVIELKSKDNSTIAAFEKTVDEYGMQDNIILQCFELEVLKILEDYYPDMKKMHLSKDQWSFENALSKEYVDIVSVKNTMMSESNCQKAHENHKEFSVWTLDSEQTIKTAIEMDVDSYFTNYTDIAIKAEKEYRK